MDGLRSLLAQATTTLTDCGVDSPRLSAEVLLAKALETDRNEILKRLVLAPEEVIPTHASTVFFADVARRAAGEPVAYITGVKEFYGREFSVSPATLIPRPETELLVETALQVLHPFTKTCCTFADFGTGSGCIAITLGLELPHAQGIALDTSAPALDMAKQNAKSLDCHNVRFLLANFTDPPLPTESLHLIVSNPPYISEEEYTALSNEVRSYEPRSALVPETDIRLGKPCPHCLPLVGERTYQANVAKCETNVSGKTNIPANATLSTGQAVPQASDGTEDLTSIIQNAARYLRSDGWLLMEIGYTQGRVIQKTLDAAGWKNSAIIKDLAGLDRIAAAQRKD